MPLHLQEGRENNVVLQDIARRDIRALETASITSRGTHWIAWATGLSLSVLLGFVETYNEHLNSGGAATQFLLLFVAWKSYDGAMRFLLVI